MRKHVLCIGLDARACSGHERMTRRGIRSVPSDLIAGRLDVNMTATTAPRLSVGYATFVVPLAHIIIFTVIIFTIIRDDDVTTHLYDDPGITTSTRGQLTGSLFCLLLFPELDDSADDSAAVRYVVLCPDTKRPIFPAEDAKYSARF